MRVALVGALMGLAVACGPSPANSPSTPTGTLVVVIREGAERVPFQPKVDRIRRANEQISDILGHSIKIELDGSLLPQDHEGAQDVIAHLVETVAQDLAALKKHDPKALPFAASIFQRLVVRYSPAEAAQRGRHPAELDRAEKTIDVVLDESRWRALERAQISSPLLHLYDGDQENRYGHVLPEQLSASERDAWFHYHMNAFHTSPDKSQMLGSVNSLEVRGFVTIASERDGARATEARKYLIERVSSDFSTTYHHHQAEVEAAPAGSPFRLAETAFVNWFNGVAPTLTVDERNHVARYLFVYDFRKNTTGEKDRWASYAYPGLDRMAWGFSQADAWIASGHPKRVFVYDEVVAPARVDNKDGDFSLHGEGKPQADFYRWALTAPAREDAFVKGLLQRKDPEYLITAFYNAHSALHDEGDYIRFLRRFEQSPAHWRAGAEVERSVVYTPSTAVLEESRRHWRELPIARGYAFYYFARQAEHSYHPEVDWPDMLQDRKADDAVLKDTLSLGWPAFELAPVFWRQLQKTSTRIGLMETTALDMLAQGARARPGAKDVAGILADIGRQDCEDENLAEVAALRQWATSQLESHPGQGLSKILESTDPKECKPRRRASAPPPKHAKPPTKPKWKEGDPLPPKDPF